MRPVILRTADLTKRFRERSVVTGVNLEVRAGDVFGFLGRNGAGKTTTIRMITGLIDPTAGSVEICGADLRRDRAAALRHIGAIVETPALYDYLSGRENLDLCARLRQIERRRIDEALEQVGLRNRAQEKVRTYSLGMKQRLGIAVAMLARPPLLILDEPANGLDPQGILEMRRLIADLNRQGVTLFLSSHLLHEIEQTCAQVAVIDQGRIVAQGEVQSLLSDSARQSGAVELQLSEPERAVRIAQGLPFVQSATVAGERVQVRLAEGPSSSD